MNVYERELKEYVELNRIARGGNIVIFGSTFTKNIPASELAASYDLDLCIYNRSISDLSVFDASSMIETCISDIEPSKILIQLGETDLARGFKTIPEIITEYKKIIAKMKEIAPHSEIVILSVCCAETEIYPEQLNKALSVMARDLDCRFADITPSVKHNLPYIRAFEMLKPYIRNRKISFYDAMNMVHI